METPTKHASRGESRDAASSPPPRARLAPPPEDARAHARPSASPHPSCLDADARLRRLRLDLRAITAGRGEMPLSELYLAYLRLRREELRDALLRVAGQSSRDAAVVQMLRSHMRDILTVRDAVPGRFGVGALVVIPAPLVEPSTPETPELARPRPGRLEVKTNADAAADDDDDDDAEVESQRVDMNRHRRRNRDGDDAGFESPPRTRPFGRRRDGEEDATLAARRRAATFLALARARTRRVYDAAGMGFEPATDACEGTNLSPGVCAPRSQAFAVPVVGMRRHCA